MDVERDEHEHQPHDQRGHAHRRRKDHADCAARLRRRPAGSRHDLAQRHCDDRRNDERQDAADDEQALPVIDRQHPRRRHARNHAAQRDADACKGRRARMARPVIHGAGHGETIRHDDADADADEEAQDGELLDRDGRGGDEREDAIGGAGDHQGPLAAVAVAERRDQRRAHQDSDQAGAQQRPELGARDIEGRHDRGPGEVRRLQIEAFHHQGKHHEEQATQRLVGLCTHPRLRSHPCLPPHVPLSITNNRSQGLVLMQVLIRCRLTGQKSDGQ